MINVIFLRVFVSISMSVCPCSCLCLCPCPCVRVRARTTPRIMGPLYRRPDQLGRVDSMALGFRRASSVNIFADEFFENL